ncbi:hypothetical protein D9M68_1004240 [compost metagenome]
MRDISNWKEFQEIRNLLYFASNPEREVVSKRVERLGEIAVQEAKKTGSTTVLVSCPPWMMHSLCAELLYHNLRPVVSFTKKTSEEGLTVLSLVAAA